MRPVRAALAGTNRVLEVSWTAVKSNRAVRFVLWPVAKPVEMLLSTLERREREDLECIYLRYEQVTGKKPPRTQS